MLGANRQTFKRGFWVVLLGALIGATLYHLLMMDKSDIQIPAFLSFLLDPDVHPGWFFALLAILPMLGAPISVFCLLAGAKFGAAGGALTIAMAMLCHLLASYWLAQSFLKQPLHRLLHKRGYDIGQVPADHQLKFAITFTAIPVIPYIAKNYLLAMSHIGLRSYLIVTWSIQMLYSIPFIAITGAIQDNNPMVFVIGLLGIVVVYLVSRWAKRSRKEQPEVDVSQK